MSKLSERRKQRKAQEPITDNEKTISVLCDLLEWAKGNKGSKDINPYGVPEVKAALQHLADMQGIESYLDVKTKR